MRRSFPFALAACGLSVSAAGPAAAQDLQVYGQVRLTVNNVTVSYTHLTLPTIYSV